MDGPPFRSGRRLACAVLLQAMKDVRAGNGHSGEAWQFLQTPEAAGLATALDLDPARLGPVMASLPEPMQPVLPGLW
jgi:hypothetical protein